MKLVPGTLGVVNTIEPISLHWRGVELREELWQAVVEVLAGVDQHLVVDPAKRPRQRRRLDELGAVADDGQNLHPLASATSEPPQLSSSSEPIRAVTCSALAAR